MRDRPLYSIGTVSELLDVHPETLRVWERHGLLSPARRRGHRCYTDADLQRLLFIRHLIDKWGLNLSGVHAYLRLYPCWLNDRCPSIRCTGSRDLHAKPCWRRPRAYCASPMLGSEPCGSCNGKPPARPALIEGLAPLNEVAVEENLAGLLVGQRLASQDPAILQPSIDEDVSEFGEPATVLCMKKP
ncbi:MAG: MerR family transcriptional regulator [Chloroflexota bacterium]|jgi:MerR family transcriptional regulator/heat shock protein HspR